MDRFGNGVVAWQETGSRTLVAARYSAAPPAVTALAAKRNGFRLRVSEPAKVAITVRGRGRRATMTAVPKPRARTTVRFNRRVKRLLRRPGRYRAVVRASDGGAQSAKAKRLTFRRR